MCTTLSSCDRVPDMEERTTTAERETTRDMPTPPLDAWWSSRIVLRVEVGSTAHGTGLPGGEDYDELAVVADPYDAMVGIDRWNETITYRPGRAEGERSQPGDYDLVVHGARKYCRLAAQGNPSILIALYGPVRGASTLGVNLRANVDMFWSLKARDRFLGYARAQRERLLDIRGGRHTNRPELVAEHGYDTKYAMHMLRLGLQGIEYMETGRLKLPMDDARGDFLRSVRRGEHSLTEVLARAESYEHHLSQDWPAVPAAADVGRINNWLRRVAASYAP